MIPCRDFAAISLTHRQPNILVVHPSLPVKSVKELIALAKAKPGQLNYASSGLGSTNHLAGELFNVMTGAKTVRINFKGAGAAVQSVLSGEVHLMYANLAAVSPFLESGRLRPLAITSAEPSALRPGLPTMAAAGLPGFEAVVMTVVCAPAGTPAAIVSRLNQEIVRVHPPAGDQGKVFGDRHRDRRQLAAGADGCDEARNRPHRQADQGSRHPQPVAGSQSKASACARCSKSRVNHAQRSSG